MFHSISGSFAPRRRATDGAPARQGGTGKGAGNPGMEPSPAFSPWRPVPRPARAAW
jgi:hypothetical protein